MKIFIFQIILMSMVFSGHTVMSQSNESIFYDCNTLSESSKRSDCEKETILKIINTELAPYLSGLKTSGPEFNVWLYFEIENGGMVHELEVIESINTPVRYELNEIKLTKKFVPVRINNFTKSEKYEVSLKLNPTNTNLLPVDASCFLKIEQGGQFKVVEMMPRFPGCEQIYGNLAQKETCAKEKMLTYIYSNLEYPEEARKNNIEGQVVLQFVVEKDGGLKEIKVVRDPGYGLGQAALKVVESMNIMNEKWIPGTRRGKKVKVMYTLPVKFKL